MEKSYFSTDTAAKTEINTPAKAYLFAKRAFDVFFSSIFLVVLSPLFLVVALCILFEDGAPVIHKRMCVGQNGEYIMYKFRSMKKDADKLEKWLTPEQIEEYKKEIKLDSDPRITRCGKILRRTSIDELPQLLSILKGDMSFVGPRPVVPDETHFFGERLPFVLSAKPGLTGYWQVNGRSNTTYDSGERQKLELFYAANRSAAMDLKIIFATFKVVLTGNGAK